MAENALEILQILCFLYLKTWPSPDFQRFKSLDPPPLPQNFIDDPTLWSPSPPPPINNVPSLNGPWWNLYWMKNCHPVPSRSTWGDLLPRPFTCGIVVGHLFQRALIFRDRTSSGWLVRHGVQVKALFWMAAGCATYISTDLSVLPGCTDGPGNEANLLAQASAKQHGRQPDRFTWLGQSVYSTGTCLHHRSSNTQYNKDNANIFHLAGPDAVSDVWKDITRRCSLNETWKVHSFILVLNPG